MERTREEIMPSVWLTALRTEKFKTDVLSVTSLTQLSRETAAMNAVIPSVLRLGTVRCPDMRAVDSRLEELYGALAVPVVRRIGEIQATGFLSTFAGAGLTPGGDTMLEDASAFIGELLLSPNTRGGLFLPDYVEGEKQKLLEKIRARVNDKGSYAIIRLIESMCCYEDFAVYKLGDEESAEAIQYRRLTKHYRETLASSPIEIFYCGGAEAGRVRAALLSALNILPRGEIDCDLGTDIRMNAVEDKPRYFTEEMDVTQGKLAIGWRLGEIMDEPDMAAIMVFNAVFGGSVTSKLFANVREKLSLCYYASSAVDLQKGLLIAASGVDFDKYEPARDEIFAQLEAIKRGEVTEEELTGAKKAVETDLRLLSDDQLRLEGWWLSQNLAGGDVAPEDMAALCASVTLDDVVRAARSAECDAVYFLKNAEGGEGDGE